MRVFRENKENRGEAAEAEADVSAGQSPSAAAAAVALQEETAVTNVDSIHTIETSFVTSTAV